MKIDTADIHTSLGSSVLVVLWWVALWFMFEEAILFVSGNRRHVKMMICLIITASIIAICSFFPHHLSRF
jgi:hypothetical protein